MKMNSFVVVATITTTLCITGCQTSKNLLNGFIGGNLVAAKLPEMSSSRIQFVMQDSSGYFTGAPNSSVVKVNGKSEGLVASAFTNQLLSKENKQRTTQMNLNMPKPIISKNGRIVERYVNSNEQIYLEYHMGTNNGTTSTNCTISGRVTPKANTDYRITGGSNYKKCYILLEEFIKDRNGNITTQPIRFE